MARKKNTYDVEGKKYRDFAAAVGKAADLSLERNEAVVVVEYGQTGVFAITIRAQSEEITQRG